MWTTILTFIGATNIKSKIGYSVFLIFIISLSIYVGYQKYTANRALSEIVSLKEENKKLSLELSTAIASLEELKKSNLIDEKIVLEHKLEVDRVSSESQTLRENLKAQIEEIREREREIQRLKNQKRPVPIVTQTPSIVSKNDEASKVEDEIKDTNETYDDISMLVIKGMWDQYCSGISDSSSCP